MLAPVSRSGLRWPPVGVSREDITKAARDGVVISVGLGVLVYQRAQVQRQELMRILSKVAAEFSDRRQNPDEAE